ncbi:MAG: ABC transporter substrate-binding protein [Leptospiraceae bacterium]|nr:ABC transporter substrate-binding protein [Leptospiraceae bacterium]MCP5497879.1 ABC transporter substrate-binding protein [Leptospiraceae bacterium]
MKKLILLVLLLSFLSCEKGNQTLNNVKIYIPKTLSSIPIMETDKAQIGSKSIQTTFYQDHILTMLEFEKGKIDLIMTGFTLGVSYYHSNSDIVMVAVPVWGVSSLVSKKPYKSLNDFIGKKVLVPFAGSPLDLQFRAILTKSNLADKLQIDYAVIQQAVPMLLAEKADGICIPEPLVSKLLFTNQATPVFYFPDKWAELYQGEKRTPQVAIFSKKKFAKENPEFILKFIQTISYHIQKINKDTTIYSEKYSNTFQLEKEVVGNGLKHTLFEITNNEKELSIKYLEAIGMKKIPQDDFFYNSK